MAEAVARKPSKRKQPRQASLNQYFKKKSKEGKPKLIIIISTSINILFGLK